MKEVNGRDLILDERVLASQAARFLQEKIDDGFSVFMTINEFEPQPSKRNEGKTEKRSESCCTYLHGIYLDLDDYKTEVPDFHLEPTLVVNTSENGRYAVFMFSTPIEATRENVITYKSVVNRLIKHYNVDATGNVTRLLRIPGSRNTKYESLPLVTIERFSGVYYDAPQALLRGLPEQQSNTSKQESVHRTSSSDLPELPHSDGDDWSNAVAFAVQTVKSAGAGHHNEPVSRYAATLARRGAPGAIKDKFLSELFSVSGLDMAEMKRVIDSAWSQGEQWRKDDDTEFSLKTGQLDGKSKLNGYALARKRIDFIYPELRFDVLKRKWMLDGKLSTTTATVRKLYADINERWSDGVKTPRDEVEAVLHRYMQHPDKTINTRLEYYDGLNYDSDIDAESFLRYEVAGDMFGIATDFEQTLFIKALVGNLARVYVPGTPVDAALIIQGVSSCGKTTAVHALFKDPQQDVLAQNANGLLNGDPKRYGALMNGRQVILMDEAEALTRTEEKKEEMKSFITSTVDTTVGMYESEAAEVPRGWTLIGTVNPLRFLPADAPYEIQRRFLPVRTVKTAEDQIDIYGIAERRDEIWSAVKALYQSGYRHGISGATEIALFKAHVEQFCGSDAVEDQILGMLLEGGYEVDKRYTLSQIIGMIPGMRYNNATSRTMSGVLRSEYMRHLGVQRHDMANRAMYSFSRSPNAVRELVGDKPASVGRVTF
jgi:hypothetical protein